MVSLVFPARRLLLTLRSVDLLPFSARDKLSVLLSNWDGKNPQLEELERAVNEQREPQNPYLEHVGRLHYLRDAPGKSKRTACVSGVASDGFSRTAVVADGMMLDHLHVSYSKAMDRVAREIM